MCIVKDFYVSEKKIYPATFKIFLNQINDLGTRLNFAVFRVDGVFEIRFHKCLQFVAVGVCPHACCNFCCEYDQHAAEELKIA